MLKTSTFKSWPGPARCAGLVYLTSYWIVHLHVSPNELLHFPSPALSISGGSIPDLPRAQARNLGVFSSLSLTLLALLSENVPRLELPSLS